MAIKEKETIQPRFDGLTLLEDRTLANIARAISLQCLRDRHPQYLTNSELLSERDRAWANIADLNPKYTKTVLMLKGKMEEAKRLMEEIEELGEDEPLSDSFIQVVNKDARAILKDILRVNRYAGWESAYIPLGDSEAEDCECDIYDEIISSLPPEKRPTYVRFNEAIYPTFEDLTPERVIELVLQGKIYC